VGVHREAVEEPLELLVEQGVLPDALLPIGQLDGRRELAVDEQVRGLEEGRLLGQLLDRVAAVAQDAILPSRKVMALRVAAVLVNP
jgi:hypothetical protein